MQTDSVRTYEDRRELPFHVGGSPGSILSEKMIVFYTLVLKIHIGG
jgi:hypothetical protein